MQMGHEAMFNQSGIDVCTGLKSKVSASHCLVL